MKASQRLSNAVCAMAMACAGCGSTDGADAVTAPTSADAGVQPDGARESAAVQDAPVETASEELSVKVIGPASGATVTEGGALQFSAEASGGVPPYAATWTFGGAAPEASSIETGEVAMMIPGAYTAQIEVTDAADQSAVASVEFTVASLLGDMRIWFGNLHSHSGASDGEGDPDEVYTWARDEEKLDFYAMTDHAESLFGSEWSELGAAAEQFDEPGVFAALRGFEWSHPINGHICIYATDDYTAAYASIWIDFIYDWIDDADGLAQFNHPGREIGVFNDLSYEASVGDNMFAIETGNKGDGNNDGDFFEYYVKALDKGWRVAPTNNQDNHKLSINSHRTAYVGQELSAEGLLEAMRARRLYSTDDPDIEVVFRAGAAWMGSTIPAPADPLELAVKVVDDEPIVSLRILTNGGEEAAVWTPPSEDETEALWMPEVVAESGDYFFLEVTSLDENDDDGPHQIALTAPIWIE